MKVICVESSTLEDRVLSEEFTTTDFLKACEVAVNSYILDHNYLGYPVDFEHTFYEESGKYLCTAKTVVSTSEDIEKGVEVKTEVLRIPDLTLESLMKTLKHCGSNYRFDFNEGRGFETNFLSFESESTTKEQLIKEAIQEWMDEDYTELLELDPNSETTFNCSLSLVAPGVCGYDDLEISIKNFSFKVVKTQKTILLPGN